MWELVKPQIQSVPLHTVFPSIFFVRYWPCNTSNIWTTWCTIYNLQNLLAYDYLTWNKIFWTHKLDTRDWWYQMLLLPFVIGVTYHHLKNLYKEKPFWFFISENVNQPPFWILPLCSSFSRLFSAQSNYPHRSPASADGLYHVYDPYLHPK